MRDSLRKWFGVALVAVIAAIAVAVPASASVKVKFGDPGHDLLYIHGRLTGTSSNPTPARDILTYGATWELRKYTSPTDYDGTRVFITTLPPGACVDKGNSCKFTDSAATKARLGITYVKAQYKTGRTWIRVYGDLGTADTADLEFRITINYPNPSTWSHRVMFRHMPWGWYLSDKCWEGCP